MAPITYRPAPPAARRASRRGLALVQNKIFRRYCKEHPRRFAATSNTIDRRRRSRGGPTPRPARPEHRLLSPSRLFFLQIKTVVDSRIGIESEMRSRIDCRGRNWEQDCDQKRLSRLGLKSRA
ncbi:hypothetical protein EVAR_62224_1 [Eumeta japonica]|uniref:Uncharacterized protein n=1 Tax=Eumeta variegata TaxID=151549 RepID=A0A4C1ZIM4_EUMVA|nr:hypothetical protein EVAR_62224_1 [Eumeta japonica]